jgi:hypothetical protein
MWPFKKKEPIQVPKLEFTERQTSPYSDDNVTVIHMDDVVYGTIVKTKYQTWKVEFCGSTDEYMDFRVAIHKTTNRWNELNTLRRIGHK